MKHILTLQVCMERLDIGTMVDVLSDEIWCALGWKIEWDADKTKYVWISPEGWRSNRPRPNLVKSFDAQHALAKAYGIEMWNGYRILAGPYDGYWRAAASETVYIPGKDFAGRMKAFPFVAKHREWAELGALLSVIEYKQAKG